MKALTNLCPYDPPEGGTFVTHHMVFHSHIVKELLQLMVDTTGSQLCWPRLIMSYSRKFYRFSEYKTYSSYLHHKYPYTLQHHRLADFGEYGLRFRDAKVIVKQIIESTTSTSSQLVGLSYQQVVNYMTCHWQNLSQPQIPTHIPAYVQLDHVYGSYDEIYGDDEANVHIINTHLSEANDMLSRNVDTNNTRISNESLPITNNVSVFEYFGHKRKLSIEDHHHHLTTDEMKTNIRIICSTVTDSNSTSEELELDTDGYPVKIPPVRAN
jgi:hypothetical protein